MLKEKSPWHRQFLATGVFGDTGGKMFGVPLVMLHKGSQWDCGVVCCQRGDFCHCCCSFLMCSHTHIPFQ